MGVRSLAVLVETSDSSALAIFLFLISAEPSGRAMGNQAKTREVGLEKLVRREKKL